MLRDGHPQIPVVAGDATAIALFASGKHKRKMSERAQGTLRVLLVGGGKHQSMFSPLAGPANGIMQFRRLLNRRERRLFQQVEVHTLLDKQATRVKLDRGLAQLAAVAKPQDLVLFYFSGHGLRRDLSKEADGVQELVLMLYDFDDKGGGQLTHSDILKALGEVKARQQLVILDF